MNINDMSKKERIEFYEDIYRLPAGNYGELVLSSLMGIERNIFFRRGDKRISIGNIKPVKGIMHGVFDYPDGLWIDDLLLLVKNNKLEKEALKNKDVELLSTYKSIEVTT